MNFETLKNRLLSLGYKVSCFETMGEATDYVNSQIDGTSVGIGGSKTVEEMGLFPRLSEHNDVWWHWYKSEDFTVTEIIDRQRESEVYISSVNGIAETGEIINIDGTCNRVADIFYGHKKVFLLVGSNKVAPDYESALWRARNIAAPKNAARLQKKTPCVAAGRCLDCASPERICRGLSVLWSVPKAMGCEYEVVLINEPLGY